MSAARPESLTPVAREALVRARWRAASAHGRSVLVEDVLAGVLGARPNLAVWILGDLGVDVNGWIDHLGQQPPLPASVEQVPAPQISKPARELLGLAGQWGLALDQAQVGSEHLVLAMPAMFGSTDVAAELVQRRTRGWVHPMLRPGEEIVPQNPWAPEHGASWLHLAGARLGGGDVRGALDAAQHASALADELASDHLRTASLATEAGVRASLDCTEPTWERLSQIIDDIPDRFADARCDALVAGAELRMGRADLEGTAALIDNARSVSRRPSQGPTLAAIDLLIEGLRHDPRRALDEMDRIVASGQGSEAAHWMRPVSLIACELAALSGSDAQAAERLTALGVDHRNRAVGATERAVLARSLASLGDRRASATLASLHERADHAGEAWIDATTGLATLVVDTEPRRALSLVDAAVVAATEAERHLLALDVRLTRAELLETTGDRPGAESERHAVRAEAEALGVTVLARRAAGERPL